jgi:hypothetical protein
MPRPGVAARRLYFEGGGNFEGANPAAIDDMAHTRDLIARGDGQYAALHPAWVESLA